MITEEQIKRINELAHKQKSEEGLSEAEKEEQATLRKLYVESFKKNLRAQLEQIKIVDNMDELEDIEEIEENPTEQEAFKKIEEEKEEEKEENK